MKQIAKVYKTERQFRKAMIKMSSRGWRSINIEHRRQVWGFTTWVMAFFIGCATFGLAIPILLFVGRGERIHVVWER